MERNGTVLVTGAASGIGFASAARLVRDGWRVALVDRDGERLAQAQAEIGAAGTTLHVVDVTDEGAVGEHVRQVAAAGPIAGLVNSAGIASDTLLRDTSVELFRRIFEINVIGSFLFARSVAAELAATGGGSIVNIASVSGIQGNMGRTAYGASKGAVITMTKVMAVELAESGIRVNAVAPGPVDTPMVKAVHRTSERESWLRRVPLRRYAEPHEIASGIAYLIDGTLSGYVTGHILAIDGGFSSGGTIRPMPDA